MEKTSLCSYGNKPALDKPHHKNDKLNYLIDMDVIEVVLVVQRFQQSMHLSDCTAIQCQQKCNFHFVHILFGHQFGHLWIEFYKKSKN